MTCEHSRAKTPIAPPHSANCAITVTNLSLPEVSRAKIFRAREKALEYAEREADFGRNLRVSFARFDRATYSWKIPHFLFHGALAKFLETWPRWGMMVHGECFPLPQWVANTYGSVFGELSGGVTDAESALARPTPTVYGVNNNPITGGGNGLATAVKIKEGLPCGGIGSATGPTPTVHDKMRGQIEAHGREKRKGYGSQGNLNDEVVRRTLALATGPTPRSRDHWHTSPGMKPRDDLTCAVELGKTRKAIYPTIGTRNMGGCSGSFNKLKRLVEIGRQPPEDARAMAGGMKKTPDGAPIENRGFLNPDWEEWLMDWPRGWTDPDAVELTWLDPANDPADLPPDDDGYIPRITLRRKYRPKRVETIGNGQVPMCAVVAFIFGREIIRVAIETKGRAE
jgi:hypothetical protein